MCRRKQEEIAEYNGLIDATYGLHAQKLTGMPHGGEVSNPTAITAERAEKLRDAYRRRIADITDDIANLMDFCAAIDSLLLDLSVDQYKVIDLRYRRFNTAKKPPWVRVARMAGVSEDWARELERKAVDSISKNIDIEKI
jgi:hypothetical protein